jgi:hypothetical protein
MIAENIWNEEHGIPTRFELARDLLKMPMEIECAETKLNDAKIVLAGQQDDIADFEANLLLAVNEDGTPKIDGKNAEQRAAQVRTYTAAGRENIRRAENRVMHATRFLNRSRNRFSALKAVAALIAGEDK